MKIMSTATEYLAKPIKKLSTTGLFKAHASKYINNSTKYIAGFGVGSIVVKDGFGCYYYVTQSYKNEKIPKEKRKFVAALDLANGALMIATQIGMFFGLSKGQDKLFDKFFGKTFEKAAKNGSKELAKKVQQTCLKNFKVITSLVGSAIIAKRMIVPFIATPTATWIKKKYMDKENHDLVDKNVNIAHTAQLKKSSDKNADLTFAHIKESSSKIDPGLFNDFLKHLY